MTVRHYEEANMTSWHRHIYKKIAINSSSTDLLECQTVCYFDGQPCHMLHLENGQCHLGNFVVDTNEILAASGPEVLQVHYGMTIFVQLLVITLAPV